MLSVIYGIKTVINLIQTHQIVPKTLFLFFSFGYMEYLKKVKYANLGEDELSFNKKALLV